MIGGEFSEKELYILESFISQDLGDTLADMEEPELVREDTLVKQVSNEPDQIKRLMKNFANKKGAAIGRGGTEKLSDRAVNKGPGLTTNVMRMNKTDMGVYHG